MGQFEDRFRRTVGSVDSVTADSAGIDSMEVYQDFLHRYLNFRLKVKAARDAGFDTLSSLRAEIAQFRRQTARPTLIRREVIEPIVREVYERRMEEVKVRHLLIRVPEDAPPSDTLRAYRRLQSLVDSLGEGVSLGDLAERHSDDPSAQRAGRRGYRGDLGYLTAGQVVEPFEEAMYETPVDSLSSIFRTRFGYHVLRVEARRPRLPPVRVSHILIRPDSASSADSLEARQRADSLRTAIRRGASFEALAREHSDDPQSAPRGGDLGRLESGSSLPPPLREAMTTLEEGEVSGVVSSRYGYHLMKLTDREERPSFSESYAELKQQLNRLPRVEAQEQRLARDLRREYGSTVDTTRILQSAGVRAPDTLAQVLLPPAESDSAGPALTLGDSTYTVRQLARFVAQTDGIAQRSLASAIDAFLNETSLRYAATRLEARDEAFATQMRDYREGLLLFQFMQDSVWSAAVQDTARLRSYYREHTDRYRFPRRVRTSVLRAPADTLLRPYLRTYRQTGNAASMIDRVRRDSLVSVDTAYVTRRSSAPYRSMTTVADGSTQGPLQDEGEWIVLIRDRELPARPKSFAEARSDVVRDVQDAYEETVVQRLRDRYQAEVYPERLTEVFSTASAPASSSPPSR